MPQLRSAAPICECGLYAEKNLSVVPQFASVYCIAQQYIDDLLELIVEIRSIY